MSLTIWTAGNAMAFARAAAAGGGYEPQALVEALESGLGLQDALLAAEKAADEREDLDWGGVDGPRPRQSLKRLASWPDGQLCQVSWTSASGTVITLHCQDNTMVGPCGLIIEGAPQSVARRARASLVGDWRNWDLAPGQLLDPLEPEDPLFGAPSASPEDPDESGE